MSKPTITNPGQAPLRTMSEEDFDNAAESFFPALTIFADDLQSGIDWMDLTFDATDQAKQQAELSAQNASGSEQAAEGFAQSAEDDAAQTALDRIATGEDRAATETARNEAEALYGDLDAVEQARIASEHSASAALDSEVAADSSADRAEAARDAAFVNADIYDDVADGLSGTSDGDQFQVVEGAEVVRYRNDSGSAVEVARYPEAELVNIALDVASRPGLVSGEFYTDDSEQPVYSITDEDGNALASWDQQGNISVLVDIPSGSSEIAEVFSSVIDTQEKNSVELQNCQVLADAALNIASQPGLVNGEFYADDEEQPLYAITDENGNALASWDQQGHVDFNQKVWGEFYTDDSEQTAGYMLIGYDDRIVVHVDDEGSVVTPWFTEFYTDDAVGDAQYVWLSREGVIVHEMGEDGAPPVSRVLARTPESLPESQSGAPHWDRGFLRKTQTLTDLMLSEERGAICAPHTKQIDFYDSLMQQHPENIAKEKIGESASGSDIFCYTFDFAGDVTNGPAELRKPPVEIILVSGLHGGEYNAQVIHMALADAVANRWYEHPVFSKLRWQCKLRMIPASNPDGVDAGTRVNANGVDLNRNFPTGWGEGGSADPASRHYRGESAGSEPETQSLMALPDQYPDASIAIDLHTHWGTNYVLWCNAANPSDYTLMEQVLREWFHYQVTDFGDDPNNPLRTRLLYQHAGTLYYHWDATSQLSSLLHETVTGTTNQLSMMPGGSNSKYKQMGLSSLLLMLDALISRETSSRITKVET